MGSMWLPVKYCFIAVGVTVIVRIINILNINFCSVISILLYGQLITGLVSSMML